ncbi:DUF58 domain-containing protein [Pantanalinema rosaneae CENA516]|uniref:DUF58 domain-containing protein n=1 Tax=Pantanalinema rosaneae TaxID=1620701 RepID=UPI003D6E510A
MLPSRRVYFLLILGTIVGLATAVIGSDLINPGILGLVVGLTVVYDALLLAITVLDGTHYRSDRVTAQREPLDRLSIGRENTVRLMVKTGKRPAILQIRDFYPEGFYVSNSVLSVALPANHTEELTYTVFPLKRGEYAWGDLQVRQLGAWGLAWQDWKVPQSQKVAVYPDLIGLRSLSIRLTLQTTGNIRRARRLGMGTEFTELRDYVAGDDPRFIDWKATARRDRVLVRVLEPEQEQTLMILLDQGRLMTAQVNGLTRFDWGLNAALSLAMAGLQRGDRVGIGVFDRQINTWIPPERGQSQLPKILERLTPLQPALLEPDYVNAVTTVATRQTRRALVVLITDVIDATASIEVLAAMGRLAPRHLPFCVTLRDPQIDQQANTLTTDVSATYARAIALDLLNQRQLALAKLKQKGVLILDAPADRISEELVDRYLQLKARNQL